jgi:hypothetical protein
VPTFLPWLAALGFLLMSIGTIGRRLFLRRAK